MERALCISGILWGLFAISFELEFMNPGDVLSQASTSCIVASSYENNWLIPIFQELEETFVNEPSVIFGVFNLDHFKWPNENEFVVKDNPSTVIKDTDIIIFSQLKMDRTCLLIPEENIKVPDVHLYEGAYITEPIVQFINQFCGTYRDPDGSLSSENFERRKILDNLFHLRQAESPAFINNGNNEHAQYCTKTGKGGNKKCLQHHTNINIQKYADNTKRNMIQCDKISPPTEEEFVNKYLKYSKPVIIQGATSHWQAFKKWTNDYFRQKFGEKVVHIKLTPKGEFEGVESASIWEDYGTFDIPEAVRKQLQFPDLVVVRPATLNLKFSEFLDIVEMVSNGSLKNISAYLEYTSISDIMTDLEADVEEMAFFRGVLDLKHINIWLSDGNTLGKLHFDPFDNFLCMINGKKEVIMFDPHDNTRLYEAHIPEAMLSYNRSVHKFRRKTLLDSTSMVMSPVDILNPDFRRFPKFAEAQPINCTIEEGEVLYMPAFWWHEVQSYPNTVEGRNLAVNFWYDPFLTKEFPCPDCQLDINPAYRHML